MKRLTYFFCALICALTISIPTYGDVCSGISNETVEGGVFNFGYNFATLANGDVQIQFEWLGDGEPANIYFHDYETGGLVETPMTRDGKVGTKIISGRSAGDILVFACKFDKNGVYRTRRFIYKVGYNCAAECSERGNIAAGKVAKAGYSRMCNTCMGGLNANEQPQFAVDGKNNTQFIAWGADGGDKGPYRWFAVDLGAEYNLTNIKIYWQNTGDRCSNDYVLQVATNTPADFENDAVASNTGWTTVKTVQEAQNAGVNSYDINAHGRYVRLWANDTRNIGIVEFEVYSSGCAVEDNIAPVLIDAMVDASAENTINTVLYLTATDQTEADGDATPIYTFQVKVNDGEWQNVTTNTSTNLVTVNGLQNGDNTILVQAIDAYGNTSSQQTIHVRAFNIYENLAYLKPIEVGYVYPAGGGTQGEGESIYNVNDGILTTHWVTWGNTNQDDSWWYVDLGGIYQLREIQVYFTDYSTDFLLQVRTDAPSAADKGNDEAWTTIEHFVGEPLHTNTLAGANIFSTNAVARYVRFKSLKQQGANTYFRLWEIMVYGSDYITPDETNKPVMTNATLVSQTQRTGDESDYIDAIVNLTATDVEDDAAGTGVHLYELTDASGATWQVSTNGSNQTTITLPVNTQYQYTVRAIDSNGNRSENAETLIVGVFDITKNLAYKKPAFAGYQQHGDTGAENKNLANDGTVGTYWTTYGNNQNLTNEWWYVDLKGLYELSRIEIVWNEDATAFEWQIAQTLPSPDTDNSQWVSVETGTSIKAGADQNTQIFTACDGQTARYVRFRVTTCKYNFVKIAEIRVYGSDFGSLNLHNPVMTTATLEEVSVGVSGAEAVINVAATDEDVSDNPITRFQVYDKSDNSLLGEYTTTNGQISISGLDLCATYNFAIVAKDNAANLSEPMDVNSAIVTPQSTTYNFARSATVTAGYEALPATYAVDGAGVINANDQTRWGTGGRPSIDNDWIQLDLGEPIYIDHIKIQWEEARPQQYQILLSLNGIDWQTWQYHVAPHWEVEGNHAYETYNMSGAAARYIKVQSLANVNDAWGISIWEFEVYGTSECYVADDVPPVMVSAAVSSATSSTATISVSATDNITNPVTNFKIGDDMYVATAGAITMENLSPCQTYTWRIYAMDGDGNLSLNYIDVTHQVEMPAEGTNLALLHPVYSGFDEGGCPKGAAVDGDRTTRWATTGRPRSDDEWLVVDLQGIYKIDSIQVEWEYGTSINYEFKTAYEAEFGKNGSWDVLTSGHFATFDHRNEQPEGAKTENMELNEKTHQTADHVIDHYYYTDQQVYGRFIELKSGLMADYASSLWEIRVYGQCAEISHKPVMQWAEIIYANDHEAELYVSALDYETPEERMGYKVVVTGGEAGYTQISTEYIFTYSQFANGSAGHLILGGLIPDVPYEVKIYAIDEDGNTSDNYKTLTFTTLSPDGCVFSGTEAYNVSGIGNHSSQIFQKGYRVTINGDEDSFTIIAYTDDDFYELDPPIIQILVSDPSNPVGSSVEQRTMVAVAGQERTYEYTFNRGDNVYPAIRDWTGKVKFFVKYPFRNGGICLTYPIEYDVVEGCPAVFVIFHQDDQPTATSRTTYAGGTIENSISYYRHFTAGIWEDLTMPFDVDSIMVYDTEDHRYYKLTAQYNNGSTVKGKFLLRKQVDLVSGEDFQNSWYDGDSPLPQKGQPYAIRFTSSYYADKYVLFKGHKGQTIATDFSKGIVPTADDQYQVYGNPTMSYQSVGTAYLLDADHQEEIYRRVADAQVRPFETYVLASPTTTSRMAHIAPWRPMPEITTGLDETEEMMTVRARVDVFTVTGQHIGTWTDATLQDVSDECANRLQPGCYVVHSTGFTAKMIVK